MKPSTDRVHALTADGYSLLQDVAKDDPALIRAAEPERLISDMLVRHEDRTGGQGNGTDLFTQRSWPISHILSLVGLDAAAVAGPSSDAVHAEWLHSALPTVKAADMSDQRMLAAINCFHLPAYSNIRWKTSNLWSSSDPKKQARFVKGHWFGNSKQSNTAARLWWLYELAKRAEEWSEHDTDTLLHTMANNVNFYHQMIVRRQEQSASDRVRAHILDVAIRDGHAARNRTSEWNHARQRLNLTAGAVNLDIITDDALRELIEGVMPPKEGTPQDPQR